MDKEEPTRYLEARLDDQSVVIEYNTKHKYIAALQNDEKELRKFLLQVGIIVAFHQVLVEDLASEDSRLFTDMDSRELDPSEVLPRVLQEVGKFMYDQKVD